MWNSSKFEHILIKPIIFGIISSTLGFYFFGATWDHRLELFGIKRWAMSAPLALGIDVAASNVVEELLKNYVIPYIPDQGGYFYNMEEQVVVRGISGLATMIALHPNNDGTGMAYLKRFGLGFIRVLGADWGYKTLLPDF